MKKFISLILMALSLFCCATAVGCNGCGNYTTSYTVTLDANGGSLSVTELSFEVGQSYELPTPTKEGYTFKTWMLNSSKFASKGIWNIETNVNLKAQYEANKCNVKVYDAFGEEILNTQVSYEQPYEIKFPSDMDGIVKGLKIKGTDQTLAVKGDKWTYGDNVELEVDYKPITVIFSLDGGTADFSTILVEYGKEIDFSPYEPKKSGYVLDYWIYGTYRFYTEKDKCKVIWSIAKETVELKAIWRGHTSVPR